MPPRPIRPNPDECLRARVHAGLTVTGAALQAGCTRQHLSNIENGKVGASESLIKALADIYGVPMTSLFTWVEDVA